MNWSLEFTPGYIKIRQLKEISQTVYEDWLTHLDQTWVVREFQMIRLLWGVFFCFFFSAQLSWWSEQSYFQLNSEFSWVTITASRCTVQHCTQPDPNPERKKIEKSWSALYDSYFTFIWLIFYLSREEN